MTKVNENRLMPDGKHYDLVTQTNFGITKNYPAGTTFEIFHSPEHRVFFRLGEETIEIPTGSSQSWKVV